MILGTVAALLAGCVGGEAREGSRVEVVLEVQEPGEDARSSLPDTLELVFDHSELLSCDWERPELAKFWKRFSLIKEAEAAHLPAAPHRLSSGDLWRVINDGETHQRWTVGTLRPVVNDYCGVRFGFYSALPETPAVEQGAEVGVSIYAKWDEEGESGEREIQGSLGFDIEVSNASGEAWLSEEDLQEGPGRIVLSLNLEGVADQGRELSDPRALALLIVEGATVELENVE